ncbi:MAG: ATP-binding cassette domain-containing protein [Clostridiales bacterium]|jgi:putative ABC transport system ATP-binding protein|nr:ATP-binding cassette domain-containing protein [Clostridiales bacterium]
MYCLEGVKYRDILAIDSLCFPTNKITSVVGESGSGKTTLLRLLNKLISNDEGTILFNGTSLRDIDSILLRRKVVMLSQLPAIFPGSVKDNLLLGFTFADKPPVDDEKLYEALKMVHLSKELSGNAETLSGGEKQRLALARVILMEPDVFLLDEPSSALDDETEQLIIEKLVRHTRETGKTLIMVTHSKKVAREFSDVIIELKNGRVVGKEGV